MMQNALKYIKTELSGLYPDSEINHMAYQLIEFLTGWSKTEIVLNKNTHFSDEQQKKFESFVEKLKKMKPIQYVLGDTEFFGLSFRVDESVLIPRPETEELVEWIQTTHDCSTPLRLLDIGTGSGCIAISLKHVFPQAKVDGFDISEEALATARANASLNHLSVEFFKVDILNPPVIDRSWDIIVSNPPYITHREKSDMHPNVLENEPHLALFVPDDDALLFYRRIGRFAFEHLSQGGELYFEINRAYGQKTIDLLSEIGFTNIELRKDLSGNDRMVKAVFNS